MFYRCSIECTNCGETISSVLVQGRLIPRRRLQLNARTAGAVSDGAGRWYCGPSCRTAFRLTHDTSKKETPHV